jgi:hypothetical protein
MAQLNLIIIPNGNSLSMLNTNQALSSEYPRFDASSNLMFKLLLLSGFTAIINF